VEGAARSKKETCALAKVEETGSSVDILMDDATNQSRSKKKKQTLLVAFALDSFSCSAL